jgi:hypothetical protein
MSTTTEITVDERGRTSLARVRRHEYERYAAEEFPDGTLVLTPVVSISAVEAAALADPAVRAAIAAAKTGDPGTRRRRLKNTEAASRRGESNP